MDDAVFVTQKAITSVDVVLKNVYSGKKVVHLDGIKRVRLPAPQAPESGAGKGTGKPDEPPGAEVSAAGIREWLVLRLRFLPPEGGGYGLLHPECGSDRILLQNALNTLLQPEQPAQTEPELETPLAPQPAGRADPYHGRRPCAAVQDPDPDHGCTVPT